MYCKQIITSIESRDNDHFDYPKTMCTIYDALKAPLIDSSNCSSIALEQLEHICSTFGGVQIYLCSDTITFRNLRICADFDGCNVSKLARQHKISVKSVYSILSKMRNIRPSLSISSSMSNAYIFDNNQSLFHETTVELYDTLAQVLEQHAVDRAIAYSQLIKIIEAFGGKQIYVPTGSLLKRRMKKFEIWHDYNGRNVSAP